jgi:hypothetical protein
MIIKRTVLRLSASLLLAFGATSSFAGVITYDFTLNGGSSGPMAGVTSSGFFSIDEAVAQPSTFVSSVLFTDFDVSWMGVDYDKTIAEAGWLNFDANGLLTFVGFGTNGLSGSCISGGLQSYNWTATWSSSGNNSFSYGLNSSDINNTTGRGNVSLALRPAAAVPEPATLGLALAGFAGLAFFRRRRHSAG